MYLNSFEKKIFNFIKTYKIFKKCDKILIAVSGGKDSMTLLNVLYKISKINDYKLGVAHFNHKIRKESEHEEKFVEEYVNKFGLEYHYGNFDIIRYSEDSKISIEQAAREKRYEFLFNIQKEFKYDKIATAHHLNDVTETLIYRLLRGTGIYGLSGLMPVNEKLTRPMLTVTLKDVEDYVTINKVEHVVDSSNFSLEYTRNKIRHKIIPEFDGIFDNYENNILTLQKILWEYRNTVEKEFKKRVKYEKNEYIYEIKGDIFDSEILRLIFMKNKNYPPNYEETKKIINMGSKKQRKIYNFLIFKNKRHLHISQLK